VHPLPNHIRQRVESVTHRRTPGNRETPAVLLKAQRLLGETCFETVLRIRTRRPDPEREPHRYLNMIVTS
jgi:hypothetical protein